MSVATTTLPTAVVVKSARRGKSRPPERKTDVKSEMLVESANAAVATQIAEKRKFDAAYDDKERESLSKHDNPHFVSPRYWQLWLSIQPEPGKGLGVKLLRDVSADKPLCFFMCGRIYPDDEKDEDSHSVTLRSPFSDGSEKRWCMLPIRAVSDKILPISVAFYVNEPGPNQKANCTNFQSTPLPTDNDQRLKLPYLQTVGDIKAGTFLNWHYGSEIKRTYPVGEAVSEKEIETTSFVVVPSLAQLTDVYTICRNPSTRLWHTTASERMHYESVEAQTCRVFLSQIDTSRCTNSNDVKLVLNFKASLLAADKLLTQYNTPGMLAAKLVETEKTESDLFKLVCSVVPSSVPLLPSSHAISMAVAADRSNKRKVDTPQVADAQDDEEEKEPALKKSKS